MKKILNSLLLLLLIFPLNLLASGNITVSPSSLTIEEGSSKSFTITAKNTIGDVSISSSDNSVATVSQSDWGTGMVEENQTKTGTIRVTGNKIGTATITLTIDAATFDAEDLSGQKRTITVNVVEKKAPVVDTRSTNNRLKELKVEGYDITKVNDNNYTLTVSNDVSSINVVATAEDEKAKVTGNGNHNLNVGSNEIEIVVTSESGKKNIIKLNVIRKDGYYLEDLESLLNNSDNELDITINQNSTISKDLMDKIKTSRKIVRLNVLNDNKDLIYSWIIDGSKIKESNSLNTNINVNYKNDEMQKASNYADGIYISLEQTTSIPEGIRLRINSNGKYKGGEQLNAYKYSSNEFESNKAKAIVTSNYVEFEVEDSSKYLLTKAVLNEQEHAVTEVKSSNTLVPLMGGICVVLVVIIIVLVIFLLKLKAHIKEIEVKKDDKAIYSNDINHYNNL